MQYNIQSQVLIGTVLGGSSLVKPPKGVNYYLSMRSQNREWIEYKISEMGDFFPSVTIAKYGETYRCNSICCEHITNIYSELYEKNKRSIKMKMLDVLTDMGIAVWFLESGGKTGRGKKNAYLNSTKFGPEGSKIIMRYFNEIEMPCNINHDGSRLKILFSVEGTESLLKVIAHRFPNFMFYRI